MAHHHPDRGQDKLTKLEDSNVVRPRLLLILLLSALAVVLMVPIEISFMLTAHFWGYLYLQPAVSIYSWLMSGLLLNK